jgi:hypothetical protein
MRWAFGGSCATGRLASQEVTLVKNLLTLGPADGRFARRKSRTAARQSGKPSDGPRARMPNAMSPGARRARSRAGGSRREQSSFRCSECRCCVVALSEEPGRLGAIEFPRYYAKLFAPMGRWPGANCTLRSRGRSCRILVAGRRPLIPKGSYCGAPARYSSCSSRVKARPAARWAKANKEAVPRCQSRTPMRSPAVTSHRPSGVMTTLSAWQSCVGRTAAESSGFEAVRSQTRQVCSGLFGESRSVSALTSQWLSGLKATRTSG